MEKSIKYSQFQLPLSKQLQLYTKFISLKAPSTNTQDAVSALRNETRVQKITISIEIAIFKRMDLLKI